MGTSIEMLLLEKTNGKPFHQLSVAEQQAVDEMIDAQTSYPEAPQLFRAGNHFELMDFFKKNLENPADTMELDDDGLYYYIDGHNIENALAATKKEIDRLLETADPYDPDLYIQSSTVGRLAQFHNALEYTLETTGFDNHYLMIDIG